ncbi:MAG: cadmium-translocating P-type ATPase [Actinomycetota bacterium]|nr:cadmium-translocating P-type ATPase [Actinomycetota bacterium]
MSSRSSTTVRDRGGWPRYPIVAATVLVGAIGAVLWLTGHEQLARWGFAGFAIIVAAIEAWGMLQLVRRRQFGIDLLAIVAIVATVAVGEVIASMIIVLMVSGGKALEDYAQGRAQRELTALLAREPQSAHRLVPGTTTVEEIAAVDVEVGDALLVRSGEIVPIDGSLRSVSASFDQSSLTGESLPVTRVAGDLVLSGSVNGNTAAVIVATALARDSQFQSIVALVKKASDNKAPVVRLADRYAIPFTAVSLLIGGIAWLASGDPVRFAEVLVLATPCPLVLAAPVAFMGGMSRAARNGIIVKGGGVLEQLARIRTVMFDKTGTLTKGTPTISSIAVMPPWTDAALLTLAASAEQLSSHVLAASIVDAATSRNLVLIGASNSEEIAAQGVRATLADHRVAIGTLRFARDQAHDEVPEAAISGGELAIYLVVDDRFAGTIVAADPVRDNAGSTVQALRDLGIPDIVMLTGDAQATADHVASAIGITQVRANCLPADKVDAVRSARGRPVLMVGDGVNDAPVLASADVGIAMGARGATSASESASAVILVDDISRVVRAIEIGRDTVRVAMQSIWLGMSLSVGLMLVAAFGVIPATLGAGVQEIVDLATILNALRSLRPRERL